MIQLFYNYDNNDSVFMWIAYLVNLKNRMLVVYCGQVVRMQCLLRLGPTESDPSAGHSDGQNLFIESGNSSVILTFQVLT